ncbi:MAG TPA: TIGR03435 family protein [Vicinamibacterales bacterium]|nr:TIGR03435 family protein [Vicinamibacterales bacterium]
MRSLGVLVLAAGITAAVSAQQRPPHIIPPPLTGPAPEFEVASVKINKSGDNQTRFNFVGGRIDVINMQLRGIIQAAYRVPANQLVNVPGWVNGTRVDIVAKADPKYSVQELQSMLQPLLVQRFKFAFHREMRDMDVYVMTVASRDGRLGPKLEKSSTNCEELGAQPRSSLAAPKPGELPACGTVPGGPGRIILRGFGMGPFVQILGLATRGRQVIDETGLQGGYNIDLTYTPEALSAAAIAARGGAAGPLAGQVDPNGPDLVTAMQEQLGLKLDGRKMALEVMVVDNIEQPTED